MYLLVDQVARIYPTYSIESARQSIQDLRDGDVFVASIQGKSVITSRQLERHHRIFNRYLSSIVPMLRRVKVSEKILKMESLNQVEVLSERINLLVPAKLIEILK